MDKHASPVILLCTETTEPRCILAMLVLYMLHVRIQDKHCHCISWFCCCLSFCRLALVMHKCWYCVLVLSTGYWEGILVRFIGYSSDQYTTRVPSPVAAVVVTKCY